MKVRIKKLSDDKFGGDHPTYGSEMITRFGELVLPLAVGRACMISYPISKMFRSSPVTQIGEGFFKTKNSTYSIEYVQQ